jgi:hypothetical protein
MAGRTTLATFLNAPTKLVKGMNKLVVLTMITALRQLAACKYGLISSFVTNIVLNPVTKAVHSAAHHPMCIGSKLHSLITTNKTKPKWQQYSTVFEIFDILFVGSVD